MIVLWSISQGVIISHVKQPICMMAQGLSCCLLAMFVKSYMLSVAFLTFGVLLIPILGATLFVKAELKRRESLNEALQ